MLGGGGGGRWGGGGGGGGGGRNVEIIGIPKIYELIDINTLYN